jgi:hypothetical protein
MATHIILWICKATKLKRGRAGTETQVYLGKPKHADDSVKKV